MLLDITRGVALLCLGLSCFQADRDIAAATHYEQHLLEKSGVSSHLHSVQSTIIDESSDARKSCLDTTETMRTNAELLQDTYNPTVLVQETAHQLSLLLLPAKQTLLAEWYQSELAKKVVQAESRYTGLSASEYESLHKGYFESGVLTRERFSVIRALSSAMRVADFVTVVNTEITNAVALMSECELGEGGRSAATSRMQAERADRSFVSSFLTIGLDRDLAFIYSTLSDQDLIALLEFAQSKAGERFHAALITATDRALRGQNERLMQSLFENSD